MTGNNKRKNSHCNNSGNQDRDNTGNHNEESKMRSLTRHHQYYLNDGTLYIMIGTTMFRIHSYFFEHEAKNFYTKLLDPTSPGQAKQGTSESTAIIVDACSVQEFELFLWVFYNPRYNIYNADAEDFFTILRLAALWDFPEVRAFALREIRKRENDIPLVQRIVLYHNYSAPQEYLVPLYAQLCSRAQAPTDEETKLIGENIGWGEVVRLFRARETVRTDTWSPTDTSTPLSPLPQGKNERDTYSAISSIMQLPEYRPEDDADLDVERIDLEAQKNASGRTSDRGKTKAEREKEKAQKEKEKEKEKAAKEGKAGGSSSGYHFP